VKALGETADWRPWHFKLVRTTLGSADPFVRRAAAEALSKHPDVDNVLPLLALLDTTRQKDAELYHSIRIALRDQLRNSQVADALVKRKLEPVRRKQLVEFAATAPSGPAALLVFDEALHGSVSDDVLIKAVNAGAKYIDMPRVNAVIATIQQRFAKNSSQQISLL